VTDAFPRASSSIPGTDYTIGLYMPELELLKDSPGELPQATPRDPVLPGLEL
jgi:hypothetical protein